MRQVQDIDFASRLRKCVGELTHEQNFRDTVKQFLAFTVREKSPSGVAYFQEHLLASHVRANRLWAKRFHLQRRLGMVHTETESRLNRVH